MTALAFDQSFLKCARARAVAIDGAIARDAGGAGEPRQDCAGVRKWSEQSGRRAPAALARGHLHPPDKAIVLSVDEKSRCQALERTEPMLPLRFGCVEGVTHDYQRHGTTTLFAALNVMDGAVLA